MQKSKLLSLIAFFTLVSLSSLIYDSLQVTLVYAAIQFEEVTQSSGMSYYGETWGGAWGDVNGDGWPDLWVNNHECCPILYLNNSDGTFTDATDMVGFTPGDMHGAAWADFDNDGDQDLLQTLGGGGGYGPGEVNQFYVNSGGVLQNRSSQYRLDIPFGRERTPLWFDWNNDGYLDIFFANINRPDLLAPSALYTQQDGYFSDDNTIAGISARQNVFAQLFTPKFQDSPALVIHTFYYPDKIYQYNVLPFQEISGILKFPKTWCVYDAAIADFNNDLLSDFYLATIRDTSSAVQTDPNNIRATININTNLNPALEKGIQFRADDYVHFHSDLININKIYIGSAGFHPTNEEFTLSSSDINVIGIANHNPSVDDGIFIGYDPGTGLWSFFLSKNGFTVMLSITADSLISELSTIGFVNDNGEEPDRLLIQTTEGFNDRTKVAGLGSREACKSVVAADFDNDMDIDIYTVCRGQVINLPNILYENLGNGTFLRVPGAGGAEGSSTGMGDSPAIADYDRDGFMDIFVPNGDSLPSPLPFYKGPHQLFRNAGNGNHWIEVDLEGVASNRDGVGTRLWVTSGGTTQLRDQDNGIHLFSQNHQRVHFGLADNTVVEQLTIKWPSGIIQERYNIPADQIFHATELDLTGHSSSGIAPFTVNFSSNSKNLYQPLSYEWDFDNNGTVDSTDTNPSYTYNEIGAYTVKLTITDFDGSVISSTRTNYITATLPVYSLLVHINGMGTVTTSSPSGIVCDTDCIEQYFEGSEITLTATADSGSLSSFAGWSGSSCSDTVNCTVVINADTEITATFDVCPILPARIIGESPTYYPSLQAAYDAAENNDNIQSHATELTEDLYINSDKSVVLKGGYNCDYNNSITGKTSLNGMIIISNGSVTVENIILK